MLLLGKALEKGNEIKDYVNSFAFPNKSAPTFPKVTSVAVHSSMYKACYPRRQTAPKEKVAIAQGIQEVIQIMS